MLKGKVSFMLFPSLSIFLQCPSALAVGIGTKSPFLKSNFVIGLCNIVVYGLKCSYGA